MERKILSRYRGYLILMLILPIILSVLPISLEIAVAGNTADAAKNFQTATAFGFLMPVFGYLVYKWMEHRARMEGSLGTF